jgi:hypothetical protein
MDAVSEELTRGFARLAVEEWRLLGVMKRLIGRLPSESQDRVSAQLRFAASRLHAIAQENGFQLETFDGRVFEPSLPVTAANADDHPTGECLIIAETIEPTVTRHGRLIQLGKVLLERDRSDASRD